MSDAPAISVIKSYRKRSVSVRVRLKGGVYGDSVKVEGQTDLTTEEARALALKLISAADAADAKADAKEAEETRRKAYRDGKIKAGRMIASGWFG